MFEGVGDNILEKNPYYCEMSGVYWIWKNVNADYCGICHYRRYFYREFHDGFFRTALKKRDIIRYLRKYDMIVQKKANYYPKTVKEWFRKDCYMAYDTLYQIFDKMLPEYRPALDNVMEDYGVYSCNMFIASKRLFDKYCEWVFPILFNIEHNLDMSTWSQSEKRILGHLSELLLNIYIIKQDLKVKELPFGQLRDTSILNYIFQHLQNKYFR